MKVFSLNFFISFLLFATLLLSSCMEGQQRTMRSNASLSQGVKDGADGNQDGKGKGSGPTGSDLDNNDGKEVQLVELRYFINPLNGTFTRKLTLPKNYRGLFYIAGLNLSSLNDKFLYVRFRLGKDRSPITLPATVGRGEGLTPNVDTSVLIVDMEQMPFQNIALNYDLYDYSDDSLNNPIQDVRDERLYCRGVSQFDDPTSVGDQYLYSYAKIIDIGLSSQATPAIPFYPIEPQVQITSDPLVSETDYTSKRCLPDDLSLSTTAMSSIGWDGGPINYTVDGSVTPIFDYTGSYRSINTGQWQIDSTSTAAIVGPKKLFQSTCSVGGAAFNCQSFLFPRYGKLSLKNGVQYLGVNSSNSAASSAKILKTMGQNGSSEWMDGCNIRIASYNSLLNEHIGSCNVTATIEVIVKNSSATVGSTETVVASSTELKLQLSRASTENARGKEVLFTSLNQCSSSRQCGSGECCYNSRCWSKEVVSQCSDELNIIGNLLVGQACTTDYQCASLCCNRGTNTCAPHVNTELEQLLCQKAPSQQCVAREFCQQDTVSKCYIVSTGIDGGGNATCELRCYNTKKFGNCRNGRCTPADPETPPDFDPANPDCSGAIDPIDIPVAP